MNHIEDNISSSKIMDRNQEVKILIPIFYVHILKITRNLSNMSLN